MSPGYLKKYEWPDTDAEAIDTSLCYHARKFKESHANVEIENLPDVVNTLERIYISTKVIWDGWPDDFGKFLRESLDWNASPGWPWKKHYPTNRDLFLFDGVNLDETRVAMVEYAVRQRWNALLKGVEADPIFLFIKPEPHKISKVLKKSWRLISGVGLTDTLVDRILYGKWLDEMIKRWPEIPSKAGWSPQQGGFKWMARAFRGKTPVSIDKSAWDWTVNEWHVGVIERLVPRMIFGTNETWRTIFRNRMRAMFHAGYPRFKENCGCEFVQQVTGIMKSGCLGTIGFNSILQQADHLAAGGSEFDLFFCLGDDTVQEDTGVDEEYMRRLKKTGAIVKEVDVGFPIKFGGHEFDENSCVPAYRSKHMYALHHLNPKFSAETLDSYRHLYALDDEVSEFLEHQTLMIHGPTGMPSRQYLCDWYLAME